MLRLMVLTMMLGFAASVAHAQQPNPQPKADCSKFHKLADGRWVSTIESRIGNPKNFITLQPGLAIDRNLTVVGINVSDTIDRLCGEQR